MEEQIVIGDQNRMIIRVGVVTDQVHPWSDGIMHLLQFCPTEGLEFVRNGVVKMNRKRVLRALFERHSGPYYA